MGEVGGEVGLQRDRFVRDQGFVLDAGEEATLGGRRNEVIEDCLELLGGLESILATCRSRQNWMRRHT